MKLTVVCAGKIKEAYLAAGISEYEKRLRPYAAFEIREVREERMPVAPSPAEKAEILRREGGRLLRLVPEGSFLFVLDVLGRSMTSEAFSEKLFGLALAGRSEIAFLIGGPFGLSEEVRRAADVRLSFSPFTFTHQMVRLLLVEQVYRACKIGRGEKYHW